MHSQLLAGTAAVAVVFGTPAGARVGWQSGSAVASVGSLESASTWGWLDATARRSPIVPVCVAEDPCDGPAVGVTVLITRRGALVARAVTDSTGRFHRRFRPGLYIVRVAPSPGSGHGSEAKTVRVRSARHVRVRLFIDTGIR